MATPKRKSADSTRRRQSATKRKPTAKKQWSPRSWSWRRLSLFLLPFVVVGAFFILRSFAATNSSLSQATKDCRYGTRCYFWANINKDLAYTIINYRIQNGMPVYPNLADCTFNEARDWSNTMAAWGRLFHSDLAQNFASHCGVGWNKLGENIGYAARGAMGSCDVYDIVNCPGAIFTLWQRSPEHNANMLDPAWNTMGMGVVQDSHGTWWFTAEFAQVR